MPPAVAAPVVGAASNIGASQTGTNNLWITIVKGTDSTGAPASGSVAGVTITLDKLTDIDPLVEADMQKIANAQFNDILSSWPTNQHYEQVTNANGAAYFSGLTNGVYVVNSTAPNDSGEYRELNPFLVAVPFHAGSYEENQIEGQI